MHRILSLLLLRCPKCRKGKFLKSHPYNLSDFNQVRKTCNRCKKNYRIEPGFFYGAMYVSYGLGVGLSILVFLILYLLNLTSEMMTPLVTIMLSILVFTPYINALSKVIWASIFIKYEKEE